MGPGEQRGAEQNQLLKKVEKRKLEVERDKTLLVTEQNKEPMQCKGKKKKKTNQTNKQKKLTKDWS